MAEGCVLVKNKTNKDRPKQTQTFFCTHCLNSLRCGLLKRLHVSGCYSVRSDVMFTGFTLGLENWQDLENMGRHFPFTENSVYFEQTGKVMENHTNYWKTQGI